MARPAQVLFQSGGRGVIVFAGQSQPAAAIRADTLRRFHDLAKSIARGVRDGDTQTRQFREAAYDLHQELATLLLALQDSGLKHGYPLKDNLRISGTAEFVFPEDR